MSAAWHFMRLPDAQVVAWSIVGLIKSCVAIYGTKCTGWSSWCVVSQWNSVSLVSFSLSLSRSLWKHLALSWRQLQETLFPLWACWHNRIERGTTSHYVINGESGGGGGVGGWGLLFMILHLNKCGKVKRAIHFQQSCQILAPFNPPTKCRQSR